MCAMEYICIAKNFKGETSTKLKNKNKKQLNILT